MLLTIYDVIIQKIMSPRKSEEDVMVKFCKSYYTHKKRKDSLGTRAELAVLRTYVENQAIPEPILLYQGSKCKQTKKQGSKDCLWTHIFTFL